MKCLSPREKLNENVKDLLNKFTSKPRLCPPHMVLVILVLSVRFDYLLPFLDFTSCHLLFCALCRSELAF